MTSRPRRYSDTAIRRLLRQRFDIHQLRPGQREVIDSVLAGHDTLAVMPTGAGKSLCYQLPALLMPGITIVVSPLIALMQDQADKLDDAGVDVAQVNSTLSRSEEQQALEDIDVERSEIVFTTPERLGSAEFLARIAGHVIDLLVIDEAHCVSQWGHDFRPAYLELGAAIAKLGHPPVLALTATATNPVIADIREQLGLAAMRVIDTGMYRPNLRYRVVQVVNDDEKRQALADVLGEHGGASIVYAATVKAVEALHARLDGAGLPAARYHGRMPAGERRRAQDAFMQGRLRLMIATNAFGMGIDKPDIRQVVHYQMPASLLAYYQESGRAGRDGKPADCVLLYDAADRRIQQYLIGRRQPSVPDLSRLCQALQSLARASDEGAGIDPLQQALPSWSANRVRIGLRLLRDAGLAEPLAGSLWRPRDGESAPGAALERAITRHEQKTRRDREALERLTFYAQTGFCRWKVLLESFGERLDRECCGHCDNCRNPPQIHVDAATAPRPARPQATVPLVTAQPAVRLRRTRAGERVAAFVAGDRVRARKYGLGEVVSASATEVAVVFADGVTRRFLPSAVRRQA